VRLTLLLALLWSISVFAADRARVLDDFSDASRWKVQHTDDVRAAIASVPETGGHALRLDFDFTDAQGEPINGYATAHRDLALDLPENYEISFRVRGDAPVNNLQFKLIDASGENVWWRNQPDFAFIHEWRQIRLRKRDIEFAWGPSADHELKHAAALEFVVSSGRDGGKGSVYFDHLSILPLAPPDAAPPPTKLTASSALPGFPASAAFDADMHSAWRSSAKDGVTQYLTFDFGKTREFSALLLHWRAGERARDAQFEISENGKHWGSIAGARVAIDDGFAMLFYDTATRYLRLQLKQGASAIYGINELEIKDLDWAPSRNAFFTQLAKIAKRGSYPRGFSEQPYWTIAGVDGGASPALVSEDGAIEPRKGGYSIEPFLTFDGRIWTWADVIAKQSLRDGYLPMPQVTWQAGALELDIETFVRGTRDSAQVVARYRLRNTSGAPVAATLQLALRPFQVNPPAQFLNSAGGVASIESVMWDGQAISVEGVPQILPLRKPDDFLAASVSAGAIADGAASHPLHDRQHQGVYDVFGYASGALVYKVTLPPNASEEFDLVAANIGALPTLDIKPENASAWVDQERDGVAAAWSADLNQVKLRLPASQQRLADAVRTAQADILMSRDGAALRPGTRSYARSWIRDGAMIADALLRLGDTAAARDYVDWYAPHQFKNGKVPCCVDHRGSDPVPENDSHGELIHAITQSYRYDGDRARLERLYPHIMAAIAYMDAQRASETGAANPAFLHLMPASISHEGYSSKPMHSYWDDFWALTGYTDAAEMAQVLGRTDDAQRLAQARDAFGVDVRKSIQLASATHAIDYVPGCAELGDFDATSTTLALSPGHELGGPLDAPLRRTFERYWENFSRRAQSNDWKDYTPYEWRAVGSFVRLGWRERAQRAIEFFFSGGARPPGWNQWAEVVGRAPRQIRFIGDMPHAWVASDFIRSALDLFAYERASDKAIVIAAGIDPAWLAGAGVGISGLRTPYGNVGYQIAEKTGRLELHVDAGAKPPGGFVLPWPYAGAPDSAQIDGKRAAWNGNELHIATAPALVIIDLAVAKSRH
jgi:F5/8 type C domain